MFGLSTGHLLILLFVVLLFGSKRLPELGSAMGRGIRGFKKGLEGVDERSERLSEREKNRESDTQS